MRPEKGYDNPDMQALPIACLFSGWCGSYAPGAQPLPEPPQHTALATMGCNAVGDSRFGSRELHMAAAAITRKARRLLAAPCAGTLTVIDCVYFEGHSTCCDA